MRRALNVYIDKTLVGELSEENNIWSFEYNSRWINDLASYPISPSIPLITGK